MICTEHNCAAYFKVYNCKKLTGEIVNSGTNYYVSVKTLAYEIAKILNKKISIKINLRRTRSKLSKVSNLKYDNKKIHLYTGWKTKVNLKNGLA